jgi:riboflavin kinase/FMN adenylyltransferase
VGVRPTFGSGGALLIETYLIDFRGDLYGQNLRVAFVDRLRGEENFENVDELIVQMGRDVERTRELCADFTGAAGI